MEERLLNNDRTTKTSNEQELRRAGGETQLMKAITKRQLQFLGNVCHMELEN